MFATVLRQANSWLHRKAAAIAAAEHEDAQRAYLRAKSRRDKRGMHEALPRLQTALAAKLEAEVRCRAIGWRGSR